MSSGGSKRNSSSCCRLSWIWGRFGMAGTAAEVGEHGGVPFVLSGSIRSMSMNLLQTLENEEIARLGRKIPKFAPGDTVVVNVSVVEGERKRVQAYEGVVIAKKNRGLNSAFTVRKMSSGEGVERTFQTYSPLIASVEVKRKGVFC